MGAYITWSEIPGFTVEDDWRVQDAEAMAVLAAPCLSGTLTFEQSAGLKAVLRQALMRWKDAGSGAVTQQQAGPWMQSVDTRTERRGMFWPSELDQLRSLCGSGTPTSGTAGTVPVVLDIHADTCALRFGALYCSCGADIAGFPLFGG